MVKTRSEVSNLKSHIGYHMRVVSNAVSYAFARKIAANDVTVAEWVVLRKMYECAETTSPSIVAEFTGFTRGAVSKLIERLLKKGLVTRAEADRDRRYQDIKLTARAISLVPKLAALADINDEEFFSALSLSERKQLIRLLLKITDHNKLTKVPTE